MREVSLTVGALACLALLPSKGRHVLVVLNCLNIIGSPARGKSQKRFTLQAQMLRKNLRKRRSIQ